MPEPGDPLDELRDRVRATQAAAERIMQMHEKAPPRGWSVPPAEATEATSEMQALVALLRSLLDMLPPDLRRQVNELMRQLLLVLRALIDWLVDRLERGPRGAAPEVEDIPIS
ncbi:MAG TPA: hypothetical protein VGJ32_14600 [Solirubrobacteraceae bacterium]|jgi:hypothetical protein